MLREFRTLIAVARHGTFAAAGAHIGLTQSAVSAQMQRLEESLGVRLFTRSGRSATLNQAGHEAVGIAGQILELYAKMGKHPDQANISGTVRIAAIQSAQSRLLPTALSGLREAHPLVKARLSPGSSLPIVGLVDSGEADAGIIVAPPFDLPHELRWQPLLRERFVLIVPQGETGKNWRELVRDQPFLLYERNSFGGRQVARFLRQAGLEPQVSLEIEEIDTIIDMVAHGLGVSLIPAPRARRGVRQLDLGDDRFFRDVGLITRIDTQAHGPVLALTDCLLQVASTMPDAYPDLVPAAGKRARRQG